MAAEEEPVKPMRRRRRRLWQILGPGLITGSADDDPSGVGTYSVCGAQFGYGLLWLTVLCVPLMTAVQEMCGRVGIVTGKGIASNLKQYYSPWILHFAIVILIVANVFNVFADLNVMAASMQMLFGWRLNLWLIIITAGSLLLQIFDPYRSYARYLKFLCLSLLAYAVVALLPGAHVDWRAAAVHLVVPDWHVKTAFVLTVVGFLGTTISPYLFFWQANEEVEEAIDHGFETDKRERIAAPDKKELGNMRTDTFIGMLFSQVITFFIIVCTAATLNHMGKTDIETAKDAAVALLPIGKAAYWLFAIGIIGTGLLAIPTLAGSVGYAIAESAGWEYGLNKRPRQAPRFYMVITAVMLVSMAMNFTRTINPVKALLYSAVLNGVAAPPLILLLLFICNNKKVMGEHTNGRAGNILGVLAFLFMGAVAALLIYYFATGQAS